MKTKGRIYRVGALLLVLCFISTVMISGTFAKYTSVYSGEDTALVAKWQFKVKEGMTDLGAPDDDPIKKLALFDHLYSTHINEKDGSDFIIAPGVKDDFTINMTFLSDVDAKVTVDFTKGGDEATDGLPIEYSVDEGTTWVKVGGLSEAFVENIVANYTSSAVAALPVNNTFTFKRSASNAEEATTVSQKVNWRWAFDGADQSGNIDDSYTSDNAVDTSFGEASATAAAVEDGGRTSYTLNVSVKAEQIAPIAPETTP